MTNSELDCRRPLCEFLDPRGRVIIRMEPFFSAESILAAGCGTEAIWHNQITDEKGFQRIYRRSAALGWSRRAAEMEWCCRVMDGFGMEVRRSGPRTILRNKESSGNVPAKRAEVPAQHFFENAG